MSEEALKSVCAPGSTTSLPPLPPLCAPSLDPAAASNQLELEMRYLVSEHRKVKLFLHIVKYHQKVSWLAEVEK